MPDAHDDLIQEWQQNAKRQEENNFRFVRSLKMVSSPGRVDRIARDLHEEVFETIDCTRCANCCRTMKPHLNDADIQRIAKHLGMPPATFIETYLERDPEDGAQRMRALPCPFLGDDGRCGIYEHRPRDCRDFPHTKKKGFIWRTYGHAANTRNCPAVYHIVTRMRRERWS